MAKKGKWKIEKDGKKNNLPDDIQDILNDAASTYVNEDGVTLEDMIKQAHEVAEKFISKDYSLSKEEKEGHWRVPPTENEQLETLFKHKYIYCNKDNLISWLEYENKEIGDYDYIDKDDYGMIPLCICGIKGVEFDKFTGISKIDISSNLIVMIDGEEQDILLGKLEGKGSNILYS